MVSVYPRSEHIKLQWYFPDGGPTRSAVALPRVVSKLRESNGCVRLLLADGTDVEVVIEEMDYHAAERKPDGYTLSGRLYVSLVETEEVENEFDLPYEADSLVGIHATENAPGEWDAPQLTFEDVYSGDPSEVEHRHLGEVDSVERID